jgi:thiol-disulfide isomerase/thioredoxin
MKKDGAVKIIVLLFLIACNAKKDQRPVTTLPSISYDKIRLIDLANNPVDLEQYRGKTMFINFWASWCKPCIDEMPSIQRAQNILNGGDMIFLIVSAESPEEINAFRNSHPYQFKYLRVENSEELGIEMLPTTVIFNRAGQLVFYETGSRKWDRRDNIDLINKISK